MALSYTESANLMQDVTFKGRVKVACLKFADSIQNELGAAPAHNARLRWAQQCYSQPDFVAGQVQPPTVWDPAVQSQGSQIPDDQLQAAVEGVVNKLI